MDKKHGYVDWPKQQTKFEQKLEWIEDRIQNLYNVFNWVYFDKRKRKVDVHIDKWDTWNMDETVAYIVVPMIKQLLKTKHGAPYVEPEDVPESLRPSQTEIFEYNTNGTTDEKFFERWDWALREMLFAFNSKLHDWEEQFESGEIDFEVTEQGFYKAGPKNTYSIDHEARKKYIERVNHGFLLFGKYYQSLWD